MVIKEDTIEDLKQLIYSREDIPVD